MLPVVVPDVGSAMTSRHLRLTIPGRHTFKAEAFEMLDGTWWWTVSQPRTWTVGGTATSARSGLVAACTAALAWDDEHRQEGE